MKDSKYIPLCFRVRESAIFLSKTTALSGLQELNHVKVICENYSEIW